MAVIEIDLQGLEKNLEQSLLNYLGMSGFMLLFHHLNGVHTVPSMETSQYPDQMIDNWEQETLNNVVTKYAAILKKNSSYSDKAIADVEAIIHKITKKFKGFFHPSPQKDGPKNRYDFIKEIFEKG